MRKVPSELGEWVLRRTDQPSSRKALSVRVSHRFTAGAARFDEDNLVSDAGLVPLLGLAEQTGLAEIITGKVSITTPRTKSKITASAVPRIEAKLSMDIVHPESAGVLIDRHRHIQAPFAYPALSAAARVGRRLMKKESGDQGKRGKAYFLPAGRLCGPVCVNNP
jgi:hypothetical protein